MGAFLFMKKDILNVNLSISKINYPFIYEKKHLFESMLFDDKKIEKYKFKDKIKKINSEFINKYSSFLGQIIYNLTSLYNLFNSIKFSFTISTSAPKAIVQMFILSKLIYLKIL